MLSFQNDSPKDNKNKSKNTSLMHFCLILVFFSMLSQFFPAGKLNSTLRIRIQRVKCYISILIQRVKSYVPACENRLKAKARYIMSSNIF